MEKSLFSTFYALLGVALIGFSVIDMVHGHYDRATLDLVIVVILRQADKP